MSSISEQSTSNKSPKKRACRLRLSTSTLICRSHSSITGEITIGNRTIVQPMVSIHATDGPIVIGSSTLIEEKCSILNNSLIEEDKKKNEEEKSISSTEKNQHVMIIGNYNVFEVGSIIRSSKIGDQNMVETYAEIGPNIELTNNCIVKAGTKLTGYMVLEPNTIVGRREIFQMNDDVPLFEPLEGHKDLFIGKHSSRGNNHHALLIEHFIKTLPSFQPIVKTARK
ncbi:hypothetical protein SNEBB_005953 [Seison nebaliae]|nr:hypothetical protein SNEBB_005953 [Seison nebaliae]